MLCDQVRWWRAFHVALDDFPSPRDFCIVAGISLRALDDPLVKFGPNVGRLNPSQMRFDDQGFLWISMFSGGQMLFDFAKSK